MSGLIFYHISVIVATIFAAIFQYKTRKKDKLKIIDYLPYIISFILLFVPLGLRRCGVGVDDLSYKNIFNDISQNGIVNEFEISKLEPGYLLINQLVLFFTNDFQVVIAVLAFLSLGFFYLGMLHEKKSANYFLAFLLFGFMIYPYFFGILRLSLAFSITFFATRYFTSDNRKKFNLLVLLATTIHYSAALLFLLNLIPAKKKTLGNLKKYYIALLILVPLMFVAIGKYLVPVMGEKYSMYMGGNSSGLSLGDFDKLPIIVLCLVFINGISKRNENYKFYVFMYSLALIISISASFVDFGRAQWYFNIYVCYVLPILVGENYKINNSKMLNYVLIPLIILYGLLYSTTITSKESNIVLFEEYKNILIDNGGDYYEV